MKTLIFTPKNLMHPPNRRLDKIFCVFLFIFFFYLVYISPNVFYVPHPDFFGYLATGIAFMQNPFSESMISTPLYSLIIYFFESVLPFTHPGIIGGTVFNVACFIIGLFLLWRIAATFFGPIGLILPILIATHYYSYIIYIQPTNIAPFTTLTIVCFYFYIIGKFRLTYIIASLSILLRHEGIAVLLSFLLCDLLRGRKKTPMILPIIIGSISVFYHAILSYLHKDLYLIEWLARSSEMPNIEFLYRTFVLLPFYLYLPSASIWAIAALLGMGIGMVYLLFQYRFAISPLYFIVLFYLVIHIFFPDAETRYGYPLLWIIYLASLWPLHFFFYRNQTNNQIIVFTKKHYAILIITSILVASIQFSHFSTIRTDLYHLSEKRLTGEWLTNNIYRPTFVLTLEPWITSYYTQNKNVIFIDSFASSTVMHNHINESLRQNKDFLIILDFHTTNDNGYFFDKFGGNYYKNFLSEPISTSFSRIAFVSRYDHWAQIYKYKQPSP